MPAELFHYPKPVSVKIRNSWSALTGWWLLMRVTWTAQAAGLNWMVTVSFQQAQWLRMDTSSPGTTGRVFEGHLPSSKRWQDLVLCFPSTKSLFVLNLALFKQLHAPEITVAVATVVLLWVSWREDQNLSRSHCALGKEWNKQRGSFMFAKTLFAQQGGICGSASQQQKPLLNNHRHEASLTIKNEKLMRGAQNV